MGIEDYKVEPAANQCMTDFFTFEKPGLDTIESRECGEIDKGVAAEDLPINFYDNDDGFWDDYQRYKLDRADRAGILTKRMYVFH